MPLTDRSLSIHISSIETSLLSNLTIYRKIEIFAFALAICFWLKTTVKELFFPSKECVSSASG